MQVSIQTASLPASLVQAMMACSKARTLGLAAVGLPADHAACSPTKVTELEAAWSAAQGAFLAAASNSAEYAALVAASRNAESAYLEAKEQPWATMAVANQFRVWPNSLVAAGLNGPRGWEVVGPSFSWGDPEYDAGCCGACSAVFTLSADGLSVTLDVPWTFKSWDLSMALSAVPGHVTSSLGSGQVGDVTRPCESIDVQSWAASELLNELRAITGPGPWMLDNRLVNASKCWAYAQLGFVPASNEVRDFEMACAEEDGDLTVEQYLLARAELA